MQKQVAWIRTEGRWRKAESDDRIVRIRPIGFVANHWDMIEYVHVLYEASARGVIWIN